MNLKTELAKPRSTNQVRKIAAFIGSDPDLFHELMEVFFGTEHRQTQLAAHIMSHCFDNFKELIEPYIPQLIENLTANPEVSIKRNTVRILQDQDIPEEYQGQLYDSCFQYLVSSNEPIAVKAFSMTIAANMASIYPELKNELKPVIEEQILYGSPGLKSRGKKTLKHLMKL
ncbi:MAG: hypothetical protein JXR07_10055 [Reichenbachiella sp.]